MFFVPCSLITMSFSVIVDSMYCSFVFLHDSGQQLSATISDMGVSVSSFLDEIGSYFNWSVPRLFNKIRYYYQLQHQQTLSKAETSSHIYFWQA